MQEDFLLAYFTLSLRGTPSPNTTVSDAVFLGQLDE